MYDEQPHPREIHAEEVDNGAVDAFQERAAILEHDGGLSRDEAEQRAANEIGWEALLGSAWQVLAGEHAAISEIEACGLSDRRDTRSVETTWLGGWCPPEDPAAGAADG